MSIYFVRAESRYLWQVLKTFSSVGVSEFDSQGQSQEAIAMYTKAIQLDPNHVKAYFYRSNTLALEGQPQKGIEDAQKATAILESRGQSQWAEAMRQHEQMIREGIEDGEF